MRRVVDEALREKSAEDEGKIAALDTRIQSMAGRTDEAGREIENLAAVAEGLLTEQAGLKTEMSKRQEELLRSVLKIKEELSALSSRLNDLERRPPPPAEPAEIPPRRVEPERVEPSPPESRPEPEPDPEPVASPEVAEWIRQLDDKDAGVRFSAAVELGKSGFAPAARELARILERDKDTFVRRAAARSLGELNAWSAVPVLIRTLEDREIFVATTASEALKTITGQEFGYREGMSRSEIRRVVSKAKAWWEDHKDDRE
jgi:hypothetical protein